VRNDLDAPPVDAEELDDVARRTERGTTSLVLRGWPPGNHFALR
jgi:hypothetical protein